MTVRQFNGSTDYLKLSIGGLGAATYGTYAAMFESDSLASFRAVICFLDSGNTFAWMPIGLTGSDNPVYSGSGDTSPSFAAVDGNWGLLVVRKATGTATARFSYYNLVTTTWTHGNATGSTGNGPAPTSGFINVATNITTGEVFQGRLAVTAAWINTVKWSADTTGDAQIEAAGLEDTLYSWVAAAPSGLWRWDGTVGAGITDMVGTANQSDITGTTQVSGDDPPGFSFSTDPPGPGVQYSFHRPTVSGASWR